MLCTLRAEGKGAFRCFLLDDPGQGIDQYNLSMHGPVGNMLRRNINVRGIWLNSTLYSNVAGSSGIYYLVLACTLGWYCHFQTASVQQVEFVVAYCQVLVI